MATLTVANITTKAVLKLCASQGIAADQLLAASGIQHRQVAQNDVRISAEQVFTLWGEAQKRTGDGLIAVHTADYLPFGAYRLIDYLLATSSNPRQGLIDLAKNFRLVNGAFALELTLRDGKSTLELHNPFGSQGPSRFYVEFVFAAVLTRLRFATCTNWRPKQICFAHKGPKVASGYSASFQCPVRFNDPANRMLLDDELIDMPLAHPDPILHEILDYQAQRLLRRLPVEDGFLSDLRQVLSEALGRDDVRLKATAKKLAISCRALQRELTRQGTSYTAILDRLRLDLAIDLLTERGIGVGETSRILGFSDSRSFYRAFKKWTGQTPQQYFQSRS
jgi:AraC-like DNA-binding protein